VRIPAAEVQSHSTGIGSQVRLPGKDTLLVLVSQSGETIEIRKLLASVPRDLGMVGVVNVESSTLASAVKLALPTKAGPETTVSTKTYNSAVRLARPDITLNS